MIHLRPLRLTLFVYDLVRLAALLSVLSAVFPGLGGGANGGSALPLVAYSAPNALFPLMGLFLLLRPADYGPFTALYAAGKAIFASGVVAWFFFSFNALLGTLSFDAAGVFRSAGILALLTVADLISVAVALAADKKNRQASRNAPDDRLPAYAVDKVAPAETAPGGP